MTTPENKFAGESERCETAQPCEHFYISIHEPGHILYWVRICSQCLQPDWVTLDEDIRKIKEGTTMSQDSSLPAVYQQRAKDLVYAYVKSRLEETDTHVTFGPDEVYVGWFCKTLANWKALVTTTLPDGMYYEVTHDGVACYDYIDAYKKFENVAVPEGVDPAVFLGASAATLPA
jgi:Family of unknown function (DUF6275)